MRRKIQKILKSEINPYVASHGGSIDMEDYVDGVVYVRMSGGCQGCGAATSTLKDGVEKALIEHFGDAIKAVVDLTDHGRGNNPYYASSSCGV